MRPPNPRTGLLQLTPVEWTVEVRPRAALSEADLAQQRALGLRAWDASSEPDERYPFGIAWAPPTWMSLVRDASGALIGRAGVLERTVLWGGEPVLVGGLSSVSTDPAFRGQGVASAAVGHLMDFLCADLRARAGLLLASRMGRPVYARLGWRVVDGPLVCAQPNGTLNWTATFPDKPTMAWPCGGQPLPAGEIDLQGLPW